MLQLKAIHTHYGDSHILHGIDLTIRKGCAVGLLGRNGMGKTTLIKSLMGYLRPTSGSVHWQERDVSGHPHTPERMSRLGIGYVPEGRGIFPNLSVRENLVMTARAGARGQREWTYERVLTVFPRLAERLDHGGHQLSGGEQQMLSIGRALMTNPDLMILDEATEGLAPLIVQEIWKVIGTIRDAGISTLVVDRNYRAVLDYTDEAIVLEKGRVVLNGRSDALKSSPELLTRYLGV
jgi:branched-chain amino acid transport system ATP-binding protein